MVDFHLESLIMKVSEVWVVDDDESIRWVLKKLLKYLLY